MQTSAMEAPQPSIEMIGDDESQVVFGPLEQGYGHTIGNALRRLLLSSIPGAAVVEVRIEGVQHECDTIAGVREDVVEILLNLKQLAVQMMMDDDGGECTIQLNHKGAGEVTASLFQVPADVRISNPELYICTVNHATTKLNIQAKVRMGKGYEAADQRTSEDKAIGTLEIDAIYSPIRKVAYRVEQVMVAGQTNLERLLLTLKTNGTVKPADAIGHAASMLQQQLQPLLALTGRAEVSNTLDPRLLESVDNLVGIDNRTANILRKLQIERIGDLAVLTEVELLEMPRLAEKSVDRLKELMVEQGFTLGMDVPDWPPAEGGSK